MGPRGIQLGDQQGLVQLDPLHAFVGKHLQQPGIGLQQPGQQSQSVGAVFAFAQGQISQWPDQHRFGLDIERTGFGQLRAPGRGVQHEARAGIEFGHDVVVVGVEPFGHLSGSRALIEFRLGPVAAGARWR